LQVLERYSCSILPNMGLASTCKILLLYLAYEWSCKYLKDLAKYSCSILPKRPSCKIL
jgi:hypothetical protein